MILVSVIDDEAWCLKNGVARTSELTEYTPVGIIMTEPLGIRPKERPDEQRD
jgi:hypothetical protein